MIQLIDSTPLRETSLVLIYFYIEFFESKYIIHFSVMYSIHKSGATKRKERHLREEQLKQETSKLPKLDTFFNLQSQSQELPAEDYELSTPTSSFVPLGDSFVSNSNEYLQ